MTFLTPEDELETYNELNKYYEIADNLSEKVSESVELSIKQKQDILYPIIDEIKEYANIMIENYILYLKNILNKEKIKNIKIMPKLEAIALILIFFLLFFVCEYFTIS